MTGFSCHYCSKVLCTRQRLDSHIMSYHRKPEVEDPTPTKIQRLDSLVRDKTEDDFKRIERLAQERQTGGGYDAGPSDDDDDDDDDDVDDVDVSGYDPLLELTGGVRYQYKPGVSATTSVSPLWGVTGLSWMALCLL